MAPSLDSDKCDKCGDCAEVCPASVFEQKGQQDVPMVVRGSTKFTRYAQRKPPQIT